MVGTQPNPEPAHAIFALFHHGLGFGAGIPQAITPAPAAWLVVGRIWFPQYQRKQTRKFTGPEVFFVQNHGFVGLVANVDPGFLLR